MQLKSIAKPAPLLGLLLTFSSASFAADNGNPDDCDLITSMENKRYEVQERRTEAIDVGVIQTNDEAISNMPSVQIGACTEQLYKMMEQVQSSIKSSIGSIISGAIGSQIGSYINNMTCREAERYYREVMNTTVGKIDDPLGIFTPGGSSGVYVEGRTTSIDVERAIELGRTASDAAKTVPMSPPGRTPVSNGSSSPVSEDARNAVNGL